MAIDPIRAAASAVRRVDSVISSIQELREIGAVEAIGRRMDSIRNTITGLGGSSDKGSANVPDENRVPLTLNQCRQIHRFNHYARRYVDFLPNEAFRKGYRVDDESSEMEPTKDLDKDLSIPGKAERAAINARKYGGCYAFLVVDEDIPRNFTRRPEEWLKQPLNMDRIGALRNIVILDPEEAQVIGFEGDIRKTGNGIDSGFRSPRLVRVQPDVGTIVGDGFAYGGAVVHASRLVYMPGAQLSPRDRIRNTVAQGYDDSIYQSAWDAISSMGGFDNALSTLVQELRTNVMKIEGLAALSAGDQAELLDMRQRQIAIGKALTNMILMGEGEEFAQMGNTPTGLKEIGEHLRDVLGAAFGMPQTILFGDTPSGLNTDGEAGRTTWGKAVAAWQTHRANPWLERVYEVAAAAQDSDLDLEGSWKIAWNPLDEPTEQERAEVEKIHAERDAIYLQWDVITPEHVAQSRFGEDGYQDDLIPLDQVVEEEEDEATLLGKLAELQGANAGVRLDPPGTLGVPYGDPDPAAEEEDDEDEG